VAELWGTRLRVASSILCCPEGRAALAAARRGGRLSATGYGRAREELESLQGELVLVGIDRPLARQAGDLAEELELRGYDAVHLASALALGADTTLVTWDEDLRRAAIRSGCAVAPADSALRRRRADRAAAMRVLLRHPGRHGGGAAERVKATRPGA
jgi:uncharacterized protein